jgi:hypothetical protein
MDEHGPILPREGQMGPPRKHWPLKHAVDRHQIVLVEMKRLSLFDILHRDDGILQPSRGIDIKLLEKNMALSVGDFLTEITEGIITIGKTRGCGTGPVRTTFSVIVPPLTTSPDS